MTVETEARRERKERREESEREKEKERIERKGKGPRGGALRAIERAEEPTKESESCDPETLEM